MGRKMLTFQRKKLLVTFGLCLLLLVLLGVRLFYLMIIKGEEYQKLSLDLHERERVIQAPRGRILDRNGKVLADNEVVYRISVIHNQVRQKDKVIECLSRELDMEEEEVREKVEKKVALVTIASNVDQALGEKIRNMRLDGVKVDGEYQRCYPYGTLASKVIGFCGKDNQGIVGLEVQYNQELQGKNGKILTITDARGVEEEAERRVEAVKGNDFTLTIDANIQMYAQQAAEKTLERKEATEVEVLVMNPKNGEMYAMVNVPEYDLNQPFQLGNFKDLNEMWRNPAINDTYEPGSIFKIITAATALEDHLVSCDDAFYCRGYYVVEDRKIRCHKVGGHGSENFAEGIQNSCKQVFLIHVPLA